MEKEGSNGRFFAAMNTERGFKSYFGEIFSGLEKLYVIKGGPGCGKSRLLREFAAAARAKGYETEEFLCSSDPTSLDGVIVKELSIGMIDGTAPHAYEPYLPGAKDKLVDLGQFWNAEKLEKQRKAVKEITERKSALYKVVYTYLSAVGGFDDTALSVVERCLEKEKMISAAQRIANRLGEGDGEKRTVRLRSAISQNGRIVLPSYAEKAKTRFSVLDLLGSGGLFLSALLKETDALGLEATVSYDPVHPERPDAVYYPGNDVSFYIGAEKDYEEKQINMRRFIDDGKMRPYKPTLRAIERHKKAAESEMFCVFASIKRLHCELESIYGDAMDFKAKEIFSAELIGCVLT